MGIRWFVERSCDEETWEFLDGAIPLLERRLSSLVYAGNDPAVYSQLDYCADTANALGSRGLPGDLGPIPEACANVSRDVATCHAWRTLEELIAIDASDPDFYRVLESLLDCVLEGTTIRVTYWFEASLPAACQFLQTVSP